MKRVVVATSLAVGLLLPATMTWADELKVQSAGIMHFALKDAGDNFTRMTGIKLVIAYDNAGAVKTKLEKGEPADVVILPKPDMAALVKARKIAPDSVHPIVRTVLSVAVRKGQPKPDISSVAAVKNALLAAKTVAYSDPAAGAGDGMLFQRDLARLGVAKQVAAKARLWKSVQQAIDEKSADLLVAWQPALLAKAGDYDLVGPLPAQLQDPEHSILLAGAATKSADHETAGDFTRVLASPESLGVFKGKGFTPP
jgi:molybdate transport system substrate-binding protein